MSVENLHTRLLDNPGFTRAKADGAVEYVFQPMTAEMRREIGVSLRTAFASGVMLATQLDDHDGAGGHTAFMALQPGAGPQAPLQDWTCDRRECFDARGRLAIPDAFEGGQVVAVA